MNSTTANPVSGIFLSMGVSPRQETDKAAEPAGRESFQRFLTQAAEKKAAAKEMASKQMVSKQQQQQQLETRQAERRLQEDKLQASIDKSRSVETTAPAQKDGRDRVSVGAPSSPQSSAQPAGNERPELTSTPEVLTEHAELIETQPLSPQQPSLETAEAQLPEDWLPVHPEVPASVSLEDIAQTVAEMTGAALMEATGRVSGREQAAGAFGILRSSPAGFYSNSLQSSGAYLPTQSASAQALSGYAEQALAGNLSDNMADKAASSPDLNLATMARQLLGAAAANTGAASGTTASPLMEMSAETGSVRDSALGGILPPLGQPVDGKPSSLAAGAVPFNPSAALKGGVGQPEWHNAIAERVAVMASKKLTSAEIQLDPPELGQLLVRVTLNQEQASVTFSSQHAAVREALDQTAHRLREMFDAEGLNLVDVDVSDRSFQQRREQAVAAGQGSDGAEVEEDAAGQPVLLKQGQGLIDQFV